MTKFEKLNYLLLISLCYYGITYIRGYFFSQDPRALQCLLFQLSILFIGFSDKRLKYISVISAILAIIFLILSVFIAVTPVYLFLIGFPISYIIYKIVWHYENIIYIKIL